MSSKPVVLFDLDGTLIDSTQAILESFETAFYQQGSPYPPSEYISRLIGHPLMEMFARLGVAKEHLEAHVTSYKAHYRTVASHKTFLLPAAREAINQAASFARLGVVTTKTGSYSRVILEHLGVMEHFEVLVGFEDVQNLKPHPEPILTALERLGVAPSPRVFMIGDTSLDIQSAQSAKVTALAVTCGYEEESTLRQLTPMIFPDALSACDFALSQTPLQ